jgi:hypothetical protein
VQRPWTLSSAPKITITIQKEKQFELERGGKSQIEEPFPTIPGRIL